MILDDSSHEIRVRKIDFISLNDKTIEFHLKDSKLKQTKTYSSAEEAKKSFDEFSRRIENYLIVKSGKPLVR